MGKSHMAGDFFADAGMKLDNFTQFPLIPKVNERLKFKMIKLGVTQRSLLVAAVLEGVASLKTKEDVYKVISDFLRVEIKEEKNEEGVTQK